MLISGKRKDVQDNNNYIKKYGTITHICPNCGNLYTAVIKLDVNCKVATGCQCELNSYIVETPNIDKICNCGKKAIQIDNAMGIIVKTLFDKGYTIESCCEGHAYVKDAVPNYDFPFITIEGNIKSFIPSSYYNKFNINSNFEKTMITCMDDNSCPCISLDTFNQYKNDTLEMMYNLVKSLPNCPFTKEEIPLCDSCNTTCDCR